jgi:hypothetical protein
LFGKHYITQLLRIVLEIKGLVHPCLVAIDVPVCHTITYGKTFKVWFKNFVVCMGGVVLIDLPGQVRNINSSV